MGINFSHEQIGTVEKYLDLVYKHNKKFNLIGTKDKKSILIRHILDSISILKYEKNIFFNNVKIERILDIGTGAGLPGMLLSIFLNNKLFYLLDKTSKKINFLNLAVEELNLKNIRIIRGRAEELARDNLYRENFDIVLARAVTGFNILSELTIPFCKINGKIIFYKSKKIFTELEENSGAILKLGGKVSNLLEIRVPYLDEYRTFLIINKVKKSPKIYPRNFNKIKKQPL
ncbi:MAG: 16S rRNA (guanine(527)-N(7))-methyltransferase RsmG [Actinobacteria bacterium RBG_13_35_12]|nr:MAG: 16S rRNA (guanine(527)-N(7))-methyltransferase RsmG [Actinobacteria bacterium RBG_13_35_12]